MSSTKALLLKWFPHRTSPTRWAERLAKFYESNTAYHAMTSLAGKELHPQVMLLLAIAQEGGRYVEVGCGGGAVARLLGRTAQVYGFDLSPIAIAKARAAVAGANVVLDCAKGDKLPLADSIADGCYSFEVLEHIWDPVAVVREMVRVTKPGGWLLISMPNHFSLDLHLSKRPLAHGLELVLAFCRYCIGCLSRRYYWNLEPHIDGNMYPDCDMVTALNPVRIESLFCKLGCDVVFVDSTYMYAHQTNHLSTVKFQRNTSRLLVKYFGDHWLILATKKAVVL